MSTFLKPFKSFAQKTVSSGLTKRLFGTAESPITLAREPRLVTIDTDSAPRILFSGEDLLLEDLPVGTKVLYPRPPIAGLPNPRAAIRYALNHPEDSPPLHALLTPGMKVTIAIDDISLPLPPMQTPDVREMILEIVCQLLADCGVDDVEIVVAVALHRRMTEAEIRRAVGDRIFDAFWPDRLYNFDAEDPEGKQGWVELGRTEHGELVTCNRRAAESDLVIYVNINYVPMDGGHKSMGVGFATYESLKAHHEPKTILHCNSYMDPKKSMMHDTVTRQGRLVDRELNVFHIETALNNRMFTGQMSFLSKNEDEFTELDRLKFEAMRFGLSKLPRAAKTKLFFNVPAAYEMIAVHAGRTEPVHEKILKKNFQQYMVKVKEQADVLIVPIPFVSPYNVNSAALNPLLVQVMALGYFFNFYRGMPLIKKGGVIVLTHHLADAFDQDHHPSYIEFFHRLLPETRDSFTLRAKYEEQFAKDPSYIEMYRRGHAYHGAHPFYMWYWGEAGRANVGKVIAVGSETNHVPEILGWDRADSLPEALSMARSFLDLGGRNPEVLMMHHPPIVMGEVG
jgi:nickel-dependent lactate racemase